MKYMSGDELAEIMRSDKIPGKDYLVVDVRDDDYVGGNIKGSLNKPSNEFLEQVDQLVKDTSDIPLIIFHCVLSQVRGPKAARMFESAQRENSPLNVPPTQEVAVLRDGFQLFQSKFRNDPALVENWDESVWSQEWN